MSKILELEISDPVKHDELYSDWTNRFSDLTVQWKKIRNNDDGFVYGALVATGRMRFKGPEFGYRVPYLGQKTKPGH